MRTATGMQPAAPRGGRVRASSVPGQPPGRVGLACAEYGYRACAVVRRALIVAASCTLVASPAVAAPSDPDATFGDGGVALVGDAYQTVRGAAVTPDGGIVVVGDSFSVTKLTHGGALDRSFGASGTATAPVPAPEAMHRSTSILVQDDGRIVIGGEVDPVWDNDPWAHFALARFLPDGSPDPSFGSGGMVVMALGADERDSIVAALAPAPGGRIVACGPGNDTQGRGALALARYDSNGHLDPGFGSGGVVRGPAGFCDAMARGPGGTLVLAGNGRDTAGNPTITAARYLADGRPDPTFGNGGIVATAIPMDTSRGFIHVLPQPDGKVVLTGQWDYQFELLRLDASGRPDPTFGAGGVVRTGAAGTLTCGPAALQANGRIVLGGGEQVGGSERRFAIARYLPDGSLDPSFAGGFVFTSLGPFDYADIGALVLQPDGKIVAIGDAGDSHGHLYLAALRLIGDGPGGAPANPDALGALTNGSTSASGPTALNARRASLRSALRSLRRTPRTPRARRALRHGALTMHLTLPAGNRLTVALPRAPAPHRVLARGTARARKGRTTLRLRTTRAGKRLLRSDRPIRLEARLRLLAAHAPPLSSSTTITLPAAGN
jgi:uncharacterized delta-60 repeat protein